MKEFTTFYNLDYKVVLENLEVTDKGLAETEILIRTEKHGKNVFDEGGKRSLLTTFVSQFLNPLIFILLFASLITTYLQEVTETVVILLAVLINVFFSTYQEYSAENTIEQLKKFIKNKALVKRGGVVSEIDAEDVTVGDIVILQYGSRVPADLRLIEVNDFRIDESILTGESIPVEKQTAIVTEDLISERKNYAFCGTLVTNGNATGVVTHIGDQTEIGKIAKSISTTKKVLTPVQTAVKNISWYIFIIAIVIVIFVFVLGIYRGEDIFEMLVLSAAVAVGAVPEALPITLTVILSIGVLNIAKKGGLIRKLAAAETLGSTTLILTDKTGTLTEGNLNLENILRFGGSDASFNLANMDDSQKEMLVLAGNNFNVSINRENKDKSKWVYRGNSFEVILTKILVDLNLYTDGVHTNVVTPFNSSNKYSVSKLENKFVVLGAPDILIQNSSLSEDEKAKYQIQVAEVSSQGKRLVALATKNISDAFAFNNFELSGVFVFSDILRKDIKQNILEIEEAGLKVKIITGDHPGTAKYIGEKVGIVASDDEILVGAQLEHLNDEDLKMLLPKIKIFARVTPEDKLRIGKLYQSLGEIVAMTGDGVNDAPSLKAMDIGVSLSSATEVAKSAADMILLKDNFKTIVDTIKVGHSIKKNIQKVFVYLMSNSLDEVFVIAGALIAGLTLPLTALQIIWVNILTGTLPALAFAYDKSNRLHTASKVIFDSKVKFLALGIGTLSSLLLFFLYYWLSVYIQDIKLVQSIFFLCFASYVLVVAYSFKNMDKLIWQYNLFDNWRLNAGVVVGLVFIFATVYTPLGQSIFVLESVPFEYMWILFSWLVLNVLVVEISKFMFQFKKI